MWLSTNIKDFLEFDFMREEVLQNASNQRPLAQLDFRPFFIRNIGRLWEGNYHYSA